MHGGSKATDEKGGWRERGAERRRALLGYSDHIVKYQRDSGKGGIVSNWP